MAIFRIYVEKKPALRQEAAGLLAELRTVLGVAALEDLRTIGSFREHVRLVQLSFDGENWNHSPVVVRLLRRPALRPADVLIAAHSYDAYNRPLSTYDYQGIRFLHFIGVRQ